jgi:hypothetical protein
MYVHSFPKNYKNINNVWLFTSVWCFYNYYSLLAGNSIKCDDGRNKSSPMVTALRLRCLRPSELKDCLA